MVVAWAVAPSAFAACQQIIVPANYISSWDSHGIENKVRIEEHTYPDRAPRLSEPAAGPKVSSSGMC